MRRHTFFTKLLALRVALGLVLLGSATIPAVKATPANSSAMPAIKTVFIILEENHNWSAICPAATYICNTLLPTGAHATQYFNPPHNHPSEPNYVWLEAGSNLGLTTDADPSSSNSSSTTQHLVTLLNNAGVSWKAYEEDIAAGTCPLKTSGQYAAKHDPFVFFNDDTNNLDPKSAYCISHIVPFTQLATDLQNHAVAQYNFITPNLCNDMHDCSVQTGDNWLSQNVPAILASSAYQNGGALFITWDEGEGGDGPIGMVVVSPFAKVNYSNSIHYTHSSKVRTMEEIFGVAPFLNDAANATDLSDLFTSAAPTKPAPPTNLKVTVQ
jgi:phospholipase C